MKRIAVSLLTAIFLLNACTPIAQVAPMPVISAANGTPSSVPAVAWTAMSIKTVTPVSSPTIDVFATVTASPTPLYTPSALPTLSPVRSTPPTLMLHRPNLNFNSLAFLKDFIQLLKLNNMEVVTYRYISEHPDITAIDKGKLFIITIDDIFLAYPIDKRVIEMIKLLREAGYPAVLGVVTETDVPDPKNVALLKELVASGWEIATHTDTHSNLNKAERASLRLVYQEVTVSMDKIEDAVGVRPITLVLPEGDMVNDIENIQRTGIYWIVGIADGNTYDVRDPIVYVGREGPYKNAGRTFKLMKERFGF
ncbi:MAG: polysaccharide deacetylase family protein [Anaerolineales bacterium]